MQERTLKALEIVRLAAELGDYDSNVIGMAAEIIAEEEFGMTKAPRGSKAIDGTWFVGDAKRTVQVKAWSESRVKKWDNSTFLTLKTGELPHDLLLLLIFSSKREFRVLYSGSVSAVGKLDKSGSKRKVQLGGSHKLMLSAEAQGEIDLLLNKRMTNKPIQNISLQPEQHSEMAPIFKIPGFPYNFKRVLRLTNVEYNADRKPIVRYADYDRELGRERNGIAIVVQGGTKVLYCSAFTNRAFAQVWLYAAGEYIFKLPGKLADALKDGSSLEIYVASNNNPEGPAGDIIAALPPAWS